MPTSPDPAALRRLVDDGLAPGYVPTFLVAGTDGPEDGYLSGDALSERLRLKREEYGQTWDGFVDLLDGGKGYLALRSMEDAIGEHIARVEEQARTSRLRADYHREVCRYLDSLRADLGSRGHSGVEVGMRFTLPVQADDPLVADGWLRPSPDPAVFGLNRRGLELDVVAGDTWHGIWDGVATMRKAAVKAGRRFSRAVELLKFRRSVLLHVLWQFEAFGVAPRWIELTGGERAQLTAAVPRYTPPRVLADRRGWYRFGQYIWNWYADCQDEGKNRTESVAHISQQLGDEDVLRGPMASAKLDPAEFSGRKLQNIIREHEEGKLARADSSGQ